MGGGTAEESGNSVGGIGGKSKDATLGGDLVSGWAWFDEETLEMGG